MAAKPDIAMRHCVGMSREIGLGVTSLRNGKLPGRRAGRSGDGPSIFCPYQGGWRAGSTAVSQTHSLVESVPRFLCHHFRLHQGTVRQSSACHVFLCAVTLSVSCRYEPCGRRTAAAGIFQNDRPIFSARSIHFRLVRHGAWSQKPFSFQPIRTPMGKTPHVTGWRYFLQSVSKNSAHFPNLANQTANYRRGHVPAGFKLKIP